MKFRRLSSARAGVTVSLALSVAVLLSPVAALGAAEMCAIACGNTRTSVDTNHSCCPSGPQLRSQCHPEATSPAALVSTAPSKPFSDVAQLSFSYVAGVEGFSTGTLAGNSFFAFGSDPPFVQDGHQTRLILSSLLC